MSAHAHTLDVPDLREKGRAADGSQSTLDRRLFMQLQAFGDCADTAPLIEALEASDISGTLYADAHDPRGVAFVSWSEDPAHFTTTLRNLLSRLPFVNLSQKPALTMFGRTYAQGYEPNLEHWLLHKPRQTAANPEWPWAIWYPLRRKGAFARLDADEQRKVLAEHGIIGRAYGMADLGHDVRLACHGLDTYDNDFVIGLTGKELHPLSAIVQRMRSTVQTSEYIAHLGPFFIGHALWQRQ
jgi:chlorite dismutase